ncbi:hypothetical protein [Trichothermofontia sp.]
MNSSDPFGERSLQRLQGFICLIPVIGFIPALWTLLRQAGGKEPQAASRLAVTLTLAWLFGYILLGFGVSTTEFAHLPMLLMSSLLTSGYFLASFWLMVRLWRRKRLYLPWVSEVSDRLP